MNIKGYIQEIINDRNLNNQIDSGKEISKTSHNPTHVIYVSNLLKHFVNFDRIQQRYVAGYTVTDTIVLEDFIHFIEFKCNDYSLMPDSSRKKLNSKVRQNMVEALTVLVRSYNQYFSTNLNIDDIRSSFDGIKMRFVVNSVDSRDRDRLRNYGILLGKTLNIDIDFRIIAGSSFDLIYANHDYINQTI